MLGNYINQDKCRIDLHHKYFLLRPTERFSQDTSKQDWTQTYKKYEQMSQGAKIRHIFGSKQNVFNFKYKVYIAISKLTLLYISRNSYFSFRASISYSKKGINSINQGLGTRWGNFQIKLTGLHHDLLRFHHLEFRDIQTFISWVTLSEECQQIMGSSPL